MASFKMKGGAVFILSLTAALAAFSLVAMTHLLMGQFFIGLILPTGALAAALAGYFTWRMVCENENEQHPNESRTLDSVVIFGAILWMIFNLFFTSEHLFTDRDPAVYNATAYWLSNHQNLQIEKPISEAKLYVTGLTSESLGFATNPNNDSQLQAQGVHLLPALQAISFKAFGINGILRLNVLFGTTALLAFYGFSRLIVRPRWAALGVLIMSLALPMLYVVRDSYSEPLTMTFAFGGLGLLVYAQRARQAWQWWLAGLVLGATALTRIDAYLILIGIELSALIFLLNAHKTDRIMLAKCTGWLFLGMAISGYIGWLDLTTLSSSYYMAHHKYIQPELLLIYFLAIVGIVAIILNWKYKYLNKIDEVTSKHRNKIIGATIGGFFFVLASRPLWYIGHQQDDLGVVSRTFSEQTLNWIVWYIGPVTTIAGIAGFILIITRIMQARSRHLLPFISVLFVLTSLYLLRPSITGDQVWATRRLLPLVIPGFVLLGMWTFEQLFVKKSFNWKGKRYNLEIIVTILVTTSVLSPLFLTYPFLIRRQHIPELTQLHTICNKVPQKAVVIWAGEARKFAVQPTRTICGNESLGLVISDKLELNKNLLSDIALKSSSNNIKTIIGFYSEDEKYLPLNGTSEKLTVSSASYNVIDRTFKRPPRNMITLERTILMGVLGSDGTIKPIDPSN